MWEPVKTRTLSRNEGRSLPILKEVASAWKRRSPSARTSRFTSSTRRRAESTTRTDSLTPTIAISSHDTTTIKSGSMSSSADGD